MDSNDWQSAEMVGSVENLTRRFDTWIEGPAALLAEFARAVRPGKNVLIALSADGASVSVTMDKQAEPETLSLIGEDSKIALDIAAFVENKQATISVPANFIIKRNLELPLGAAAHADGIVASQISSLSPIPANEVLFGHHITEADHKEQKLKLTVLILRRAKIAKLLNWVIAGKPRGVELVSIDSADRPVALLATQEVGANRNRGQKIFLTSVVVLSILTTLGSLIAPGLVTSRLKDEHFQLEQRAALARQKISNATLSGQSAATVPERAAANLKNDAVSALGALDDLAGAMPLEAYASEIRLEEGILRISGRAVDLPDILTALESSGRFAQTRQIGAATRVDDSNLSDFVIETRPLIRTGGELK